MLKWGLTWYDFKDKSNTICTFYFKIYICFLNEEQCKDHHGDGCGKLEEEKTKHENHHHLLKFTI
jgi:hypothetical protein